jgi:hypothetical protein
MQSEFASKGKRLDRHGNYRIFVQLFNVKTVNGRAYVRPFAFWENQVAMRIIGSIDHPKYKITLFKTDDRFSVKFEDGVLEQSYRFRGEARLSNAADLRQLIDAAFLRDVAATFKRMHQQRQAVLQRQLPPEESEFDTII